MSIARLGPAVALSFLVVAWLLAACASPSAVTEAPLAPSATSAPTPGVSPLAPPVSVPTRNEPTPEVATPEIEEGDWVDVEVATVGWDGLTGAPVVMLREVGGTRLLPIWIGLAEAQAIARELHGVELPRPMSHDLMLVLLEEAGAALREVRVVALRRGTYYGVLEIERADGEHRSVDARPSDGLALGLRAEARLRVVATLFDESPDVRFEPPGAERQVVRVLGLTVVAEPVADEIGAAPGAGKGVVVRAVTGAGAEAGVEVGDRILAVDDRAIEEPMDLLDTVRERGLEGFLELRLERDGEEKVVRLPLDRPRAAPREEIEV